MAGFSNLYPNLPGMLVEFKDGGMALRTDPNPPNTDSILILGTAIDGPVMEPVAVDINTAELIFGKDTKANGVPNGSTLIPAFKQAWEGGCRDIRLMRVTGSAGKVTLKTKDEIITEQKKAEENIGLIEGCDETVLQLAHCPIVRDSAKIYANGVILTNGYIVNETAGKITINRGVCDAGANLSVSYSYNRVEKVSSESITLSSGLDARLSYEPMPGTVRASKAGVAIPDMYVTITSNTVKITNYDASTVAVANDTIDIAYDAITNDVFNSTETGVGSVPFTAQTSLLEKTLLKTPVIGTVHLYVNGMEILTPGAFTVDVPNKKIHIKKELFATGSVLGVTYYYLDSKVISNSLNVSSIFGGEIYRESVVEVEDLMDSLGTSIIGKRILITKPESKRGQISEPPLVYTSMQYPTLGQLADAINGDLRNGIFKAKTDFPSTKTDQLLVTRENLAGCEDGVVIDKDRLFKALSGERDSNDFLIKQGAYQLLEDYQVDWVVPVGVYADDELAGRYDNFAYELALFCAVLSYRNKTTLGAISMKPCNDTGLAGIQEYAKKLASHHNLYVMKDSNRKEIKDGDGNPIDLGKFISVVGGPEPILSDSTLGMYNGNPAVSYVALNSILLPQSAPTNKRLPGVRGLRFRFSNAQLDSIVGNRIVTFKTKSQRNGRDEGAYVVDAMTAAIIGSDYTRVTTSKVVRAVCDQLREVCDPFIGESNTTEQKNAMAASISKRLMILKERGVILDYAFQIITTPMDQVLGQAKIELTIVPPQELRKITTVIGLKPTL